MRHTQVTSSASPTKIDESFVEGAVAIGGRVHDRCVEMSRIKRNISQEDADKILQVEDNDNLDASEWAFQHEVKSICIEMRCRFKDGRDIKTTIVEEFIDRLRRYSAEPDRISLTAGSYNYAKVDIDAVNSSIPQAVKIEVSGSDETVSSISEDARHLIANCQISHGVFRTVAFKAVLSIVFGIAAAISIIKMLGLFVSKVKIEENISLFIFIAIGASTYLSMSFIEFYNKAFPNIEFSWGDPGGLWLVREP